MGVCIETLARVNVLCVDKTGTITENTMKVHDVVSLEPYQRRTSPIEKNCWVILPMLCQNNITMAAMQEYFTRGSPDR